MKIKITYTGIVELQKKLRENCTMNDVRDVVKQNGSEMNAKIVRNANFVKGYQTGTTKRSIALEIRDNGMTAASGASTEYAPYLERGTRLMDAQPFVKPAFNSQKEIFKRDLDKLMK